MRLQSSWVLPLVLCASLAGGCGEEVVTFGGAGAGGGAAGGMSGGGAAGPSTTTGVGGDATTAGGGGDGGAGGMAAGGAGTGGTGLRGSGGMPPTGDPIVAPDGTWTWVDFPGATCRDGSTTGIGVNLNSASDEVMIYLEGGGACFNQTTCASNPSSYGAGDFSPPGGGVFDRSNPSNPVADWNFVYVPYCTGDVHSGNQPNAMVPGVGVQQFVGYANMEQYLERLVPTFPNATQVLLTGVSAGGFGAAGTTDLVMREFAPIGVTLIDDSGPPMGTAQAPTCLQDLWRQLWGLDQTILADCGTDCPTSDDYLIDWAEHLASSHPNRTAGLISSRRDIVIRAFYGQGSNNCTGILPIVGTLFEAGLDDFKAQLIPYGNFGTYYISGTSHTWIGGGSFYSTTVDGVPLSTWFGDILAGTVAHVTP